MQRDILGDSASSSSSSKSQDLEKAKELLKSAIKTSTKPLEWSNTAYTLLEAIKLDYPKAGEFFIKQLFKYQEDGINTEIGPILIELEEACPTSAVASYVLGRIYKGFMSTNNKNLLPILREEIDPTIREAKANRYLKNAMDRNEDLRRLLLSASTSTTSLSSISSSLSSSSRETTPPDSPAQPPAAISFASHRATVESAKLVIPATTFTKSANNQPSLDKTSLTRPAKKE